MPFMSGVSFPHGEVAYSKLSRPEQLTYHGLKQKAARLKAGMKPRNTLTLESKAQYARDKANRRCTRAKQARRIDEFTIFVYREAHELRKMRNKTTGIEWHVDHIIPLVSNLVCGLHVWNNFAVIPKVENLRKGNYHSVHD